VAEVVDAVIGIDTHRDSHEVEIADPRGTPLATMRISNDSGGRLHRGQPQLRNRGGPGACRGCLLVLEYE
jgi:hypothetical protein